MQTKSRFSLNKILLFPIVLVLWILLKIGAFATFLITTPFKLTYTNAYRIKKEYTQKVTIKSVKHSSAPRKTEESFASRAIKFLNTPIHIPKVSIPMPKFRLFKKGRGRPRTQPLRSYLWHKYSRFINRIFPTPLRIAVVLFIFMAGFFFYSTYLVVIAHELPSPDKLSVESGPLTTEFYDRNGQLLYRLYDGKNRTLVNLEDLPKDLIHATIAIEDKNFYAHPGIDVFGVTRAAIEYIQNQEITQGGSTITQQLIKNTLLTSDRTWERKAKEVALSFWAERIFTKDQILKMYFNEVAYGGPCWGVACASQTYFGKDPKDLNLAESAYLAGLTASPTTYSPYGANPELARFRQREVLRRMVEDRYITDAQADEAYAQELNIQAPVTSIKAPHFVFYVRQLLSQKYGEKVVSQGGLRVITTLDLKTQEMAEQAVADEVAKLGSLQVTNGAAMVTDPRNGNILAMVGSKNYWDANGGNFNVTTALRQPGSSIKPITFATGFKHGYLPGTVMLDNRVAFRNAWEVYAPVNYDGKFHGPVSIRTALGSSYNIPAVKMLALVGIPSMIQTAQDMGITTFNNPDRYGLSLTLGGGEVKMVDMMTVYGTFAQNGIRYDAQPILKVTDTSGNILEDHTKPVGKRAISAPVAYLISDILSDNKARTPAFGANSLLNFPGKTVAVKTGTTDNKRDNWTFAYTPEVVVGVWVGNNNNAPMNPSLTSGVTGAAPIMNRIMGNLIAERPNIAFERPTEVISGVANGNRDLIITGQNQKTIVQNKNNNQEAKDQKEENKNENRGNITFTDPFSTFTTDQAPTINP